MSRGHQNPEPMDDYCEIVQLGRRGVRRCDVTVFYKSVGRGEFDVDGGTIFLERKRSGNRLLTIVSKNGDTIELTRERRGVPDMLKRSLNLRFSI
ncbi:hypothetical protein ABFA07_017964 [Porites harrisoni]